MKLLSDTEVSALHCLGTPHHTGRWLPSSTAFVDAVQVLGSKLMALKTILPSVNIQRLAARFPLLLTDFDADALLQKANELRCDLGPF